MKTDHRGPYRRPRQRRGVASVVYGSLAVVGAALFGWALLNQLGDPPTPPAGSGVRSLSQAGSPISTALPEPHADVAVTTAPADAIAGGSASQLTPDVQALPPSPPRSLRIPTIDVNSPVHALGLHDDGTLAVPSGERYDEAAWYNGSPTPGEIGPSVIEGHVTSQGSTPSVFFELGALQIGDPIEVTRRDGTVVIFEIYATEFFTKDDFPTTTVYGNTDGAELRLITCGGEYDPQARAHLSNLVVFARITD